MAVAMEITFGLIITIISVIGIIGCVAALCASDPIFKKQRDKLLDQIEEE
ncbi:MAG: hypothetical protein U0L05_02960 [Schaedlerella sp.]|nr:hypothetical protein [Schaedlerella sp.]